MASCLFLFSIFFSTEAKQKEVRDFETAEKLKEILRRDMEARTAREAEEGAPEKDAKTRKEEANQAKKLRPIPPPPPLSTLMDPQPMASELTDFYHKRK